MKLYYAPGACSLSPHIVALEAGIPIELEKVDIKEHKTASGEDFYKINPKGYVPALKLDDGRFLTEGPAIVQYLADQKPGANLAPANGTFERYELQEWLGFINSEIHKSFSPLFGAASDDVKADARAKIAKRFTYVDGELAGKHFLMGEQFTAADAYLFVMLTWAHHLKIALPANLTAFFGRVAQRPYVHQAMKDEGLVK
ncbi:MAG TPA: glutathione transferase GstA [Rhizomicrobium sp.]|jgi:glutathione S-transferase|nr:glutathione transferase GstA [Rhizomicrobium sp.]